MVNKPNKLYLIPHKNNQGLYFFTNKLPENGINNKFIFNLEKPHNFLNKFNIKYKYGNNQNWKSLKNLYISKNENKELLHKIVSIGSFQIPLEKFVEIVNNRTPTSVVNVNSSNNQSNKQLNNIDPTNVVNINLFNNQSNKQLNHINPTSVDNINSLKSQSNKKLNHKVSKHTLTKQQQATANRFKIYEEKLKKPKSLSNNNFGNYIAKKEIGKK